MLDTAAGQWNPLLMAAKAGHTHTVRFLVSIMGADVNGLNSEGRHQTPLHDCAMKGFDTMCNVLLDAGADPFAADVDGDTPKALGRDGPEARDADEASIGRAPSRQATATVVAAAIAAISAAAAVAGAAAAAVAAASASG